MINHSESTIEELWIHHIGRYTDQEGITFSDTSIAIEDESLDEQIKKYFFENFKEPSFYALTFSTGEVEQNPMHQICKEIFNDPSTLSKNAIAISKYLYDHSRHPNIKAGDLLIGFVRDVLIDDELVDALCIFKSENKEAFITLEYDGSKYQLDNVQGIHTEKLDKACIIFNTDQDSGYKICAMDRSNREKEAQFWIQEFLNITPRSDDYHFTKNMIQATKHFIKDRMKPLYDIDKADEAYMMQRSKEYLQNEEEFNQGEYTRKVFKEDAVIQEFEFFREDYKTERKVELADNFAINLDAVKNQSKVFKSVLKLDKNFHVYIHGNKSMIEKGVDDSGRKYYKLFYDEER